MRDLKDTAIRIDLERSIPDHFEEIVSRFSDKLAVKTQSQRLTYDELNSAANRVAHAILAQRGMGSEPVALLFEHGALILVAILGTIKAGKIYVPLDPSSPLARNSDILTDTGASLILTNTAHLSSADELAGEKQRVIDVEKIDSAVSAENPGLLISSDSVFSILYTSGSTGKPKGVVRDHRGLLYNQEVWSNSLRINPEDRLSFLYYSHFSAAQMSLFAALLNGGCVFPFDSKREGLGSLITWLIQEEITILRSVPTLFRHLVASLTGAEAFPKLRWLCLGGEPVSRKDFESYRKYFPRTCKLHVQLGLSEAVTIRHLKLDHDSRIEGERVPVGYPVEGKEVLLLDENGEEVGPSCVGEIVVRSRYLAVGYWRRPELTAERFLPDPKEEGVRIYRTGDLGRLRPDGCLEYLGRKDLQVKVRGQRVEILEVEMALQNLEDVKQAVVVPQKQDNDEVRLVAYVVPDRTTSIQALRQNLLERLPDYMIPSIFILLESLPLTPTGKVDRQGLQEPETRRREVKTEFVGARDLLEWQMEDIWREVLGLARIGVRDDFFELGGTSLLALRLFSKIETVFKRKFPPATLIEDSTIEKLTAILRSESVSANWSTLVTIQAGGRKPPFFGVHSGWCNVLFYYPLARLLGPEQPVYALQPQGLDEANPQLKQVQEIAAGYIEEIRTIQAKGPYYLGGHSFGGTVAFEMAQQLHEQGEGVAFVGLFDSYFPRSQAKYLREEIYRRGRRFLYFMSMCFRGRFSHLRKWWGERQNGITVENYLPAEVQARWKAFQVAGRKYRPRLYAGRVSLFKAETPNNSRSPGQSEAWRKCTGGGLDVRVVPGTHGSMFSEPHLSVLAEELQDCLERAHSHQADKADWVAAS
ncbi:MAG: amino acid adenylation domain-containing protein [Acidobacteria bacterium]|nr:amino acid adenylation domain-containing protein [Acidobacteriota bacterium]